ncbi:hypothetical protein [Deinococcus hopiensis]|uniref:Uncharacterized protein n=1 Tax=Deinococcus hopiensis KR-140 TaxID=695939 RepID=A0A1W1V870_9DEIO|nr:hypothetical protein [Deinococcus hopiensis]SMB89433.1 hypothetical protein SAMN00790413_00415 [Deinococcus hopiensis KR-140]
MGISEAGPLLKARTTDDVLCLTALNAARRVRLLAVNLLLEAKRRVVLNTCGSLVMLPGGFLDGCPVQKRAP